MVNAQNESNVIDSIVILNSLSALTQKQRVVLALRTAGFVQRECGEILGLTRSAVGFIERKAKRRLREQLLEEYV